MEVIFNRQTIISFPDNPELPDITPSSSEDSQGGVVDGSMFLNEVLFTDRFTVGECNANRFECDIYDYEKIPKGTKIYVYQIVDEVEGEEPQNVSIFTGYVDECVTDRGRFQDSKHLTAYDVLQFRGNDNVAKWWANLFDGVTSVTLKDLRDSLFDYMDITCDDVTLPNDSIRITHTQKLNIISFSAMLQYITIANSVNAKTDRDGNVHFVTVSDEEPIEIDEVYAQNTSEFDEYTVPAYAGVRIINTAKNVVVSVGEDYNILEIVDNLLLLKQKTANLETIAQNILDNISNITYKPAQLDMIYSQLGIKVGNLVSIGQNVYLVCENELSGSLLVDQHISSTGASAFEDASKSYDASKVEMSDEISASSLKYYRFTNKDALHAYANIRKQIISVRYSVTEATVVTFQGVVILDVDVIDETKPAIIEVQYMVNGELDETFKPTETYVYLDNTVQRHTLNLLHFWEHTSVGADYLKVYITCTNCTADIGAFKEEGILSGMGLVGDAIWDGFIECEDNIPPISFTRGLGVAEFTDEPEVSLQEVIVIEAEDAIGTVALDRGLAPKPFNDYLQINKEPISNYSWNDVAEFTWDQAEDMFYW